jgi:hypothetical protein
MTAGTSDAALRTISSGLTFFMKIIFPAGWIAVFRVGTLLLWIDPDAAIEMRWQFLAALIAGSAIILWFCKGLKRIRVDDQALYVSNYRREIRIPLDMIVDVSENRWVNTHPVTVHLRDSTAFGNEITFMPSGLFWPFSSHPIVEELKQLARGAGHAATLSRSH